MSVSFDGIKVGDRVRLTRKRGIYTERVKVIVTNVYGGVIRHEGHSFLEAHWDRIKVLSPPKPPLPTVPGLYASREDWALDDVILYALNADGWQNDRAGWWVGVNPADVPADLVRLVPEGEPSGLLEAARSALELIKPGWSIGGVESARRALSVAIEKAEAQS